MIAESWHSLDRLKQRAGTITVQVHCIAAIIRHLKIVDMQRHIANVHSPATHFTGSRYNIHRIRQIRFIEESVNQNITQPNRIRFRFAHRGNFRCHSRKTQTGGFCVHADIGSQWLSLCCRRCLQRKDQLFRWINRSLRRILSDNVAGRRQQCRSKGKRGTHAGQP